MLTLEEFNSIKSGEIFREGEVQDSPSGLNMTGSGKALKYVAVKGYANDFAVYVHWSSYSTQYIRERGDKVSQGLVTKCFDVEPEVLELYRP